MPARLWVVMLRPSRLRAWSWLPRATDRQLERDGSTGVAQPHVVWLIPMF